MRTFMNLFSLVAVCIFTSSVGHAGALGDYKKQSMGQSTHVTEASCPEEYKRECSSKCAPGAGNPACVSTCDQGAAPFCAERESRRSSKKLEILAKGASLGAGAAAMLFDDKMGQVSTTGLTEISDYSQIWNRPSLVAQFGGGALEGGTKLGQAAMAFRDGTFGAAISADYMWDDADRLAEVDFGPTINIGTAHIVTGFQPSVLVRSGNGFSPIFGGGLRSLNTYYNDRTFIQFNPLLGYLNNQWAYDLKLAVGYRLTPVISLDVGYSHRDILNLNDLRISESGLNGAFMHLGLRMN